MPIAAVPSYLGNDFSGASPGVRFGMYLTLWGVNSRTKAKLWTTFDENYRRAGQNREERLFRDENKNAALRAAAALNRSDLDRMKALAVRQKAISSTVPDKALLWLHAIAVAPFTTGLGNEHPLENGFAFLNPYGLPYLPGSGVKGVLRQAARELARGDWGDTRGWSATPAYALQLKDETIALSVIDVLFGLESGDGDTDHVRGALSFWDVIPQIAGDSLMVEVMTPHQSHYYQNRRDRKSGDSASPHDSGQPNPICFLTVPPGSRLAFHVVCDVGHLKRLTERKLEGVPDLLADAGGGPLWRTLLTAAFEHAFAWLGFGGKTAVGYGAMQRDAQAEERDALEREKREDAERAARKAAEEHARRAAMSEAMRQIEDFKRDMSQRARQLQGKKVKPNTQEHELARKLARAAHEGSDWTAEEKRAAAEAIEEWLPKVVQVDMKDERKKLKLAALRGGA